MAQARTSIRGLSKTSGVKPQPQALSSQIRSLWGCSHQYHNNNDLHRKHTRLILHDHHRARRPHHSPRNQLTLYPDYQYQSWWSPGWGWSTFNSSFPEFQDKSTRHSGRRDDDKDVWEDRAKRRVEWIKKEVEADPYAAVFGRRIKPFGLDWGNKLESGLASLWRSVFGLGEDKSNKDTVKGAKTADTTLNIRKNSGATSVGEEVQEPVIRDGDIQRRSSTNFRGAGFEFDPISGRMVPVRSEPWGLPEERSKKQQEPGQAVEHKSNPVSDALPQEKAEADPHGLSEPNVVDSAIQKDSTAPEATGRFGCASEPSDISESPIYTSAPGQKASDCLDETAQAPQGEVRAESQLHAQVERPVLLENDGQGVLPLDTVRSGQCPDTRNQPVPERSMAEHTVSEAGLDQVGFPSRSENEGPSSVTGTTQRYTATDNRDEELQLLSARDIRAVYEPRRLSIESEIEAETPKQTDEPSASRTVFEDTHGKSPVGRVEDSVTISGEATASTSSTLPDGQVIEDLSQHEASVTTARPPITETYHIFAYDPSSAKVTEAETISSLQAPSEHLHPTEVLTRLANPAKFLPCLNQMRREGYEIVSGGGDILVFRKAPAESSKLIDSPESSIQEHSTESTQQAHEDIYNGDLSNHHSSTEQFRKSPPKSNVTQVLRRMLVGGLATGGTCYALGVVIEYFRTGGKDGYGIDGFTEFESERRHRER
ncbi:hypothetical protein BDW71DRAFT_100650 [Aspergillus fruticulosus]